MTGRRPQIFMPCRDTPSEAIQLLQQKCDIIFSDYDNPTKEHVYEKVKGVDAFFWFWIPSTLIDKKVLDAAGPSLKIIVLMSSGFNHLDLAEVKRRGIKAGYVPNLQNGIVADMAMALLLAAAKRFPETIERMSVGVWSGIDQNFLGYEIYQSTVGIVGLGGIGKAVAKRLKAFEVDRLLYSGPSKKAEGDDLGAEYVTFDELLRQSDYVIITCPLLPTTVGMFNDAAFDKMKPNSILVNVARGAIVDQDALMRALDEKKIAGAGLDVMVPEPLPPNSPLLRYNNCVLAPHIAGATWKSRWGLAITAAKDLLGALEGIPMSSPLS